MAQQQTQPATAQQQLDDANAVLDGVYLDAFFGKLASLGRVPSTEAEAADMLAMGDQLGAAAAEQEVKAAQDGASFVQQAAAALGPALAQYGYGAFDHAANQAVKSAAYDLASDPAVYNAVLIARQAALAAQPAGAT